jgi:lysylphosphatidylglycerol synthetase-like protein (DUF2156 family)
MPPKKARASGLPDATTVSYGPSISGKETTMAIILAVLLLALILGGLGFAVHVLWWIALIVLAVWLVGFFFTGAASGGPRRRWYRW